MRVTHEPWSLTLEIEPQDIRWATLLGPRGEVVAVLEPMVPDGSLDFYWMPAAVITVLRLALETGDVLELDFRANAGGRLSAHIEWPLRYTARAA